MRFSLTRFIIILPAIVILCLLFTAQAQDAQPKVPKIIRKAGGVLQGTAIKRVEPDHPPQAIAEGADGPVVVEVVIDESGSVLSSRAVSGHQLLKEAAIEASRGWKWKPTTLSGEPVKVIGTITFIFHMGSSGLSEKESEHYKNEIHANPKSAGPYYKLGEVYAKLLRYPEAIESYRQAVKLKPDFDEAHYSLASAYSKQGRSQEAIEAYKKVISLKPDFAMAYYDLADVYSGQNRLEQAIESVKEAVRIKPDYAEAYHRLGWLYSRARQGERAVEAYKKATEIKPDWATAHFNLGWAYLNVGNKEAALNEYKTLKGLKPDLAETLLGLINK